MNIQAILDSEVRALWGGGRGTSLVVIAAGWGLLVGTRMIYPVILPYLRESFDLSLTVAGLLITILWLGSALGQLPSGIFSDRFSEAHVMAVSAVIVAGALLVVVWVTTPVGLFAGTALVGIGISLYPIARITILTDLYPDRLGRALGVTMASGDVGQTVLPPVAGVIAAAIAWQAGVGVVIPVLLCLAVVIWIVLPAPSQGGAAGHRLTRESIGALRSQLGNSNLGFVSFILFLFILIWQSFTGLYPTYLVEVKGLSSARAGLLFSSFFAFGVVVKPLAGAAYDRVGMRTALLVVLAAPVVGLAMLPVVTGFWPLLGITALVSTMLGTGAITQSFLAEAFSREIRGTGLGVVRMLVATLGAIGPVAFGGIADLGYFDEGYLALAAILVLVIALTLRLPRSAGE